MISKLFKHALLISLLGSASPLQAICTDADTCLWAPPPPPISNDPYACNWPPPRSSEPYACSWPAHFKEDVIRDFKTYFQKDNLYAFGAVFVGAAILANTGLDRTFRHLWQEDFRSGDTDSFFDLPNRIGRIGYYFAPIYLGVLTLGYMREESYAGNVAYHWGYRGLRTIVLGGVQQLILAPLLGGGRPEEGDSHWAPFRHSASVSGHAFIGAIPFILTAQMTDPPFFKGVLYVASTLPALARINFDKHYLSQVVLGWSLAFFSANAVYNADVDHYSNLQFSAYPRGDGVMLHANWSF